jgi:cation-transporting ATPase 13A3/4/5
MKRDDVEQNLLFLGFIVFENKLKEGTTTVVHQLNQANIRQVMCTGNTTTAVTIY